MYLYEVVIAVLATGIKSVDLCRAADVMLQSVGCCDDERSLKVDTHSRTYVQPVRVKPYRPQKTLRSI